MEYCVNCAGMMVMCALSKSNCEHCGKEVDTPHMPSYKYCPECADKLGACQQCGEKQSE